MFKIQDLTPASRKKGLHNINDSFGHQARYGGEEFTLILPDTDIPGALDVARSVEYDLAELATDAFFENCRPVTMSFGLACSRPQRKMSPEELIAAADKALYNAKKKGRNCMVTDGRALAPGLPG